VIGIWYTMVVDGRAVTFGTTRMGMDGLRQVILKSICTCVHASSKTLKLKKIRG